MLSRSVTTALTLMVLQACLPPPRAWELGSDDTGATVQADDTATAEIPCTSIKFLPDDEDGGRTHLTIPNEALTTGSFAVDGSFTVEFYTYFIDVSPAETRTLLALGNDRAWWLKVEGGGERDDLVFAIKGVDELDLRIPAPDVGWHHIAVSYDVELSPKKVSLYVDGTREAQQVIEGGWPGPDPDDDVLRVSTADDGSPAWASQVDLLRYAPSARHQGLSTSIDPESATEGWQGIWHFSGDTSNALTGTLAGAQNVTYDQWCPTP